MLYHQNVLADFSIFLNVSYWFYKSCKKTHIFIKIKYRRSNGIKSGGEIEEKRPQAELVGGMGEG